MKSKIHCRRRHVVDTTPAPCNNFSINRMRRAVGINGNYRSASGGPQIAEDVFCRRDFAERLTLDAERTSFHRTRPTSTTTVYL